MNEDRVRRIFSSFSELTELAGDKESTKIFPNAEIIDATPTTLPSSYIIVKDEQGFYIPATKVPGIIYTTGDFVNLLYIKGTEPIAFQHGSSSAGGDSGIWPGPNEIKIGAQSYATVAAAIAAATSEDIIKLGEGTYNEILTITKNLSIIGTGYAGRNSNDSHITSDTGVPLTVSNVVTCRLKNLRITSTDDATTSPVILVNGTLDMQDCVLEIVDEGIVTNVYGVQLGTTHAATLRAYDCYISATGGLTLARAISLDSNSEAFIYKGRLECNDVIADATAGSSLYYFRPQLLGTVDKFTGAGDVYGEGYGDPYAASQMSVYRCRATHSVDQTITTGSPTVLALNSEREDTDQFHDNITNNSRLTHETPGDYSIKGNIEWEANATGYRAIEILLNGTTVIVRGTILSIGGSDPTAQSISTDYAFSSGDYVELRVWQNSGGDLDVLKSGNYSPEFSTTKLLG